MGKDKYDNNITEKRKVVTDMQAALFWNPLTITAEKKLNRK
jgi:hypothetical protein